MIVHIAALLLSAGYLFAYARHSLFHHRSLPAVGALMLMALPLACAVTFVCILLGLSVK